MRGELDWAAGDAGAQSRQGDHEGDEGDDGGEAEDESLVGEELFHVDRLSIYAVTCRQIVF